MIKFSSLVGQQGENFPASDNLRSALGNFITRHKTKGENIIQEHHK